MYNFVETLQRSFEGIAEKTPGESPWSFSWKQGIIEKLEGFPRQMLECILRMIFQTILLISSGISIAAFEDHRKWTLEKFFTLKNFQKEILKRSPKELQNKS